MGVDWFDDPMIRAITACVVLIGGLIAERGLVTWAWRPYYLLGIVLPVQLVPLPSKPALHTHLYEPSSSG